ncbi:hypothetical protein PM082_012664 [Marasmius tenuissimus]|nr:hypothetical protein PM082_012664 [Marasmius tenuissimus]
MLEGRGAVEDFDYVEAGLDVVLAASRRGNWSGVGDRPILELLTEHNVSIRQISTDPEFYVESKDDDSGNGKKRKRGGVRKKAGDNEVNSALARGFCSLKHWEGLVTMFLPKILGRNCLGSNGMMVSPEWITWWKDVEKKVKEAVGEDLFLTTNLPNGFDLQKVRAAIKHVWYWKNGLKWLPRSHEDVNANANRIDPNATENRQQLIEERWKRLTPRAQKIEYTQMLVCWLSGIVEKKTGVIMDFAEAAEPDEEVIIEYGKTMADKISATSLVMMPKPTEAEAESFDLEVLDYVQNFRPGEGNAVDNAVSMFLNSDVEAALQQFLVEGEDIGVGQFAKWSPEKLWAYVGILDGLPISFQHWTCDDPAKLPDDDTQFEGSDEVQISWHQLVFIAALLSHMSDTQLAPVEGIVHTLPVDDAPISIREQWGAVPGVAFFDDVGLGKTMCSIAGIGSLQMLYTFQNPPDATKVPTQDDATASIPSSTEGTSTFAQAPTHPSSNGNTESSSERDEKNPPSKELANMTGNISITADPTVTTTNAGDESPNTSVQGTISNRLSFLDVFLSSMSHIVP